MANRKEHTRAGAIAGAAVGLIWQLYKVYHSENKPSNFWEALCRVDYIQVGIFAGCGAFVGCLPDILEPATSPNHRGFFHSAICGGGVFYGAFGEHSNKWDAEQRATIRSWAVSYVSHLFLDSRTPKGLPFV